MNKTKNVLFSINRYDVQGAAHTVNLLYLFNTSFLAIILSLKCLLYIINNLYYKLMLRYFVYYILLCTAIYTVMFTIVFLFHTNLEMFSDAKNNFFDGIKTCTRILFQLTVLKI